MKIDSRKDVLYYLKDGYKVKTNDKIYYTYKGNLVRVVSKEENITVDYVIIHYGFSSLDVSDKLNVLIKIDCGAPWYFVPTENKECKITSTKYKSAKEAAEALLRGEKIRQPLWNNWCFVVVKDHQLIDNQGNVIALNTSYNDFQDRIFYYANQFSNNWESYTDNQKEVQLLSYTEAALALYEGKAIKATCWSTDFIYFEVDSYDKNIIKLLNSKSKIFLEFNWDFSGFSKKEIFCKTISKVLESEFANCKNQISEKIWIIEENCDKKSNIHLLTNKENTNLQAKEEKMNTKLSTQVTQVKSDAQNALWRNSASCAVQMVKVPFLNVLTTYCNNSFVLSVVKEKLETKEGEAALSYVLGTVLPLVPKVSSNKDLLRLSEEMRIKGFETLFAEVFSKVLAPLLEPLQKALSLMKKSMPEE